MSYFLITCDKDGINIREMDKHGLLKLLTPDEDGHSPYRFANFVDHLDMDKGYFGGDECMIIKGEVVVPKAVSVVTRYEI